MPRLSMMLASLFLVNAAHAAVPFWGEKASMPVDTRPTALKQGQFVWDPAAAPSGPIVVVVSLTEQMAYVYRNGLRIGYTTISTGKPGHETPTGVFTNRRRRSPRSLNCAGCSPLWSRRRWWCPGIARPPAPRLDKVSEAVLLPLQEDLSHPSP